MTSATKSRPPACPALESGDRMDAEEFRWRYSLRPDMKKAELIDGVVYVASPVHIRNHGAPHFDLIVALGAYVTRTPGVIGADSSSIRLATNPGIAGEGEPQPDILLYWDSDHGGSAEFDAEGWLVSAPDLVAEVSYSSKSYDLYGKKDLYRRIGVREYISWQVEDGRIDWWQLVDGEFVPLKADGAGVIHSIVFPGLSLDVLALLRTTPAVKLPRRPRRK